jgi:crotonobetainyl-CoA:carnitine CoA-transferase CaiB-like acyl-CoA transferase
VFATADGHVVLAAGNDGQWTSFCKAAGRPELATDARFRSNPDRIRNRKALIPIVQAIMRERSSADWIERLEAASVPCGPINDYRQVFESPQVIARGLKISTPHPLAGALPGVASPMRFSETPVRYDVPPPLLGQHTRAVLRTILGMAEAEIERLSAQKIV